MKPNHDDPSEIEAPMTRALFATDVDESGRGAGFDDDGTLDEVTRHLPDETDAELLRLANSGLAPDSSSAKAGGGVARRGVMGKIEPGQVLYSKYLVLRKLGWGAMGEVWLVRHVTLKSEHALKVIIPNFASNPVALMRFQRELEVMATLRQEHAVTIYDAVIDEDGGYIDMEYLDGQTIQQVLKSSRDRPDYDPAGPLMPLDWIVRVLDQLCEVLQVAHAKGIVHRDLKPSNMMLLNGRKPGKESLKVLDFGIAKIRDDPEGAAGRNLEDHSNRTNGFIGTPSYASPEQAMARDDVDGRSDLYSVGIMLYEFVTGRVPFRGNQWQVMSQTATAPPPSFAETNPNLRPLPELEHAILRVLSKDPDQRPSTALELFDEVREAVEVVRPAGSPALTPGQYASPYQGTPSGPTLFATDHESGSGKGLISTQEATLLAGPINAAPSKFTRESPSDLGSVVVDRPANQRTKIAVTVGLMLACILIVVGLVAFKNRPGNSTATGPGSAKPNTTRPTFERYWPANYIAVDGQGTDQVWPEKVRRTTDEVFFLRFADGIYLPEGYEVENRADLVDGWPRVISRDGVRFLRVAGDKEWVMGDWDAPLDLERADAPAHPVILNGYYIQETEVTNGQFEDYLRKTETPRPVDWERVVVELRRKVEPDEAKLHPAVGLSHKMAQLYADYMDGQIPTEAQWEFAARSRGEKRRYVWGNTPLPTRDQANIDTQAVITTAPVRSYPTDKTAQGLFDMTGNVKEMCRDRWEPYMKTLTPVRDPCPLPGASEVVEYAIRGAAYNSFGADCATTRRDDHRPSGELAENIGFRLVVECPDTRNPR